MKGNHMPKLSSVLLLMSSVALVGDYGNDWSLEYNVYEEGPRTVFEGTAYLYMTEDSKFPCLSYCFDLPEGRLAGPAISSSPNDPMIPFDWWERSGDELEVLWCRDTLPLHPLTGEDMQTYPVQTPRNFKFYIIRTEFNADDLSEMLSDWGPARLIDAPWPEFDYTLVSPWDLNGDTAVNGRDLAILIAGWKVD